jgi:hypothetical protein
MSAKRAVLGAIVAGAGIVYLTPVTVRELAHWAAVAVTVAGALVAIAYLVPQAKRIVVAITD